MSQLGFPDLAAKRGRRVLVRVGQSFEVGGHDFIKIPSAVLQNEIPEMLLAHGIVGNIFSIV